MEVKYLQKMHENKRSYNFYGGDVAEVKLDDDGVVIVISANGDMKGTIYNRDLGEVISFNDRDNGGYFFELTKNIIKDDKEVIDCGLYHNEDENEIKDFFKANKDARYAIVFEECNFWECELKIRGEFINSWVLYHSVTIDDAILEAKLAYERLMVALHSSPEIPNKKEEDNNIKHRVEFGKETYNSESIVIIDSAFIVEDEDDWDEANYGTDLSKLGFDKYVTFGTGFDIFNVLTEAEYDDMSESARHYGCTSNLINAPTGILGVFRYDDIMKYNPDFDLEELLDNYNCFIAGDFIGELKFYDVGSDGEVISIVGIGTYGEDRRNIKFKVEPMIIE